MTAASVFDSSIWTLPGLVVDSGQGLLLERGSNSSTKQVGMKYLTCLHKVDIIFAYDIFIAKEADSRYYCLTSLTKETSSKAVQAY